MNPAHRARGAAGIAFLVGAALLPRPAGAVLDIRDGGPGLTAGGFSMRITNAGIVGNAFLDNGLSFDPSFEYPAGTGNEALHYAALWVGALDEAGEPHVSGGPLLEFRPTPDPADHVRVADRGRLGTQYFVDDDGDGRVDEEILNDRDEDGDGEVDEDLGMFSQQIATADYVDDRREAVEYLYANGERHTPLGLSVHQEAFAWGTPGYDGIAGLAFRITNHGTRTLRDVFVGLYADLDARALNDRTGHLNDRVRRVGYARSVFEGISAITVGGIIPGQCLPPPCPPTPCFTDLSGTVPAIVDDRAGSGLPVVAVLPLSHTTDPLALLAPAAARAAARAPGRVSFRSTVFANGRLAERGGPPIHDSQRYAALAGRYPAANEEFAADYVVLVSCGPFAALAPGESIEFSAALVAAVNLDSLTVALGNAAVLHHGTKLNLQPDRTGPGSTEYDVGETGRNGHEICLEPPPGVSFEMDPHCPAKFNPEEARPLETPVLYRHGQCLWTDADCSGCTGLNGFETIVRWLDPGQLPPRPGQRAVTLDRGVRIEWDNMPDVLFHAGITLSPQARNESRFLGYRIWRLSDWRGRQSLVPERRRWELVGNFGPDTAAGQRPLATVTDERVDYERILYEQRLFPVGRYAFTDREVMNGFEYLYCVTSIYEVRERDPSGFLRARLLESPIDAPFGARVSPRDEARPRAGEVWVVPNPFKARADWDLPRTLGDPLTRHLDFMGLPRARCTIRIWTLAGDLVAQIEHDGLAGSGQAKWDLVSRNGQEIASGIYLFSVDSALGHQTGRFVVVR